MDEPTIGAYAQTTAAPQNELDRLFANLSEQRELVNLLESRLRVVSSPQPRDEKQNQLRSPEGVIHLSVATDAVRATNSDLRYMIDCLAV